MMMPIAIRKFNLEVVNVRNVGSQAARLGVVVGHWVHKVTYLVEYLINTSVIEKARKCQ